jgi:glycosyltransferase involved in cell wall biosynthesis
MPSIWEETAGLSAIENMMRGRVVIAPAIGGLQEMTEDAALLPQPGNSASLAEAMSKLIENPRCLPLRSKSQGTRNSTFRVANHG